MLRHANDISKLSQVNNDVNLAESAIGLKQSQVQVEASVKVLKAADETIGKLLDILA